MKKIFPQRRLSEIIVISCDYFTNNLKYLSIIVYLKMVGSIAKIGGPTPFISRQNSLKTHAKTHCFEVSIIVVVVLCTEIIAS